MFKSGIYTYAPQYRNSVANYPHDSIDELSLLFPDKECNELQEILNNDMREFVKLTNILRVGDILDVDPIGINYEYGSEKEDLTNKRVMVVDIVCCVVLFNEPVSVATHLGNFDQCLSLKDYANQNLVQVYKNDKSFDITSNVRLILKIYIEDIKTGNRYWFNLEDTSPFKIIRRTKVGDMVGDKKIEKIIPNYIMINDKSHWDYINSNISNYRDLVTNSYRCTWDMDDGSHINVFNKEPGKLTPHIDCPCINKKSANRKVCECINKIDDQDELVNFFPTIFTYE